MLKKRGRMMEYSIAFVVFAAVLWGMIFLVQKFLEMVDPSVEKIDMSRFIPYAVVLAVIAVIRFLAFEIKKRSCEKIISRFFTAPRFV